MAKVYVGTYKKYNNGSIAGGWLDLADYATYGDFLNACRKLHKNESDPEFMIQDTEDFPDGLDCLEWLSESDFNDVKAAMNEEDKPQLSIVDYSEKAFAVVGNTKPVKDELKKLGGRFNAKLSCGAGWIFPLRARESVEAFIGGGVVTVNVKVEKKDNNKFTAWLDEFLATCDESDKKYYKKYNVGAIKMGDHYLLIEKPSIENKFCFHDEGPDYELYKSLHADESKMRQYFIDQNLGAFTSKIERIEKREEVRVEESQNSKRSHLYIGGYYWERNKGRSVTEEEKSLILEGLKFGLSMFKKRLDTYLNKYGLSKLHTWTYWADA